MKDLQQSRLASVLTMLAGGWLLLSPIWISITGGALVSLMIVGSILVVAGAVQFFWDNTLPSWIAAFTALYLFVSALGFNISNAMTWNQILSSIGILIFALWDGVETGEVNRIHHGTT